MGVVSVADLHAELAKKDFRLLNVHIPHDADIPGTDAAIAYTDLDAIVAFVGSHLATKVVVYCSGNSMGKQAGQGLAARGYRAVRYVDGGMTAWQKAGYSLTNTAAAALLWEWAKSRSQATKAPAKPGDAPVSRRVGRASVRKAEPSGTWRGGRRPKPTVCRPRRSRVARVAYASGLPAPRTCSSSAR